MQEFNLPLTKALNGGLRTESRLGLNYESALNLIGLKPSPFGLIRHDHVKAGYGLVDSWPFSQVFASNNGDVYKFGVNTVHRYYEEKSVAKTERVKVHLLSEPFSNASIRNGGSWHFVDLFDQGFFAMNGVSTVFKTAVDPTALETHDISVSTGCNFHGRVMLAGFKPENFWSNNWKAFWTGAASKLGTDIELELKMGKNFVWWSSIGGGDVKFLFDADSCINGPLGTEGFGPERPYIYEILQRNEMGFMPVSFPGTIFNIKPFGNSVIVYGQRGISRLVPMSAPAPGFGLQHISNIGLASRSAVGSNGSEQVFVDSSGCLWSLSAEGSLKRFGYREYFQPMLGSEIVVTYNPVEEEFYICNATRGFVLNKSGLARMHHSVSSLIDIAGLPTGTTTAVASDSFQFLSDKIDMGSAGIKTISFIEIGGTGLDDFSALIYMYKDGVKYQTQWRGLKNGVGFFGVSGDQFQIAVQGKILSETKVDYLNIKWKRTDKRFIRGLSAGMES
jgi:hypothetical protein